MLERYTPAPLFELGHDSLLLDITFDALGQPAAASGMKLAVFQRAFEVGLQRDEILLVPAGVRVRVLDLGQVGLFDVLLRARQHDAQADQKIGPVIVGYADAVARIAVMHMTILKGTCLGRSNRDHRFCAQ